MQRFLNWRKASKRLALKPKESGNPSNVIIFGLPHGGWPIAYEVARELQAPLDILIVRNLRDTNSS